MKKKILYIRPAVIEVNNFKKYLLSQIDKTKIILEVISLAEGPRHLEYYCYGALVLPKILEIVRSAEKNNFDGVVLGCFYDIGLRESREITQKLIITAPGESSMHIAATLGQRFSIIVGSPKHIPILRENVAKYGFQNQLASFRDIGTRVQDLHNNINITKEKIIRSAKEAINSDGAEVIILGCGSLFSFYRELQNILEVPIIDVSLAALNYADFFIGLRNQYGWYFNKKNEYLSPPCEEIEAWKLFHK